MMKTKTALLAVLVSGAAAGIAAPAASAAQIGDLCRTTAPTDIGGTPIPVGAQVRILGFPQQALYTVRYIGKTGLILRSVVDQSSCYQ